MADFPYISGGVFISTDGVDVSTTEIDSFSVNSSSKTAWQEITASTSVNTSSVLIMVNSTDDRGVIFDIGIGSSGNEEVLVGNLLFEEGSSGKFKHLIMPLSIPSDARVSCRAKSVAASGTAGMALAYFAPSFSGSSGSVSVTTYGATETPVGGVAIDAGGTANTKGAWAEVAASAVEADYVIMMLGLNSNDASTNARFIFDIGIGSSGNEEILVGDIVIGTTSQEIIIQTLTPNYVSIPEGARLSVRSQSSNINVTDRVLSCALYLGN